MQQVLVLNASYEPLNVCTVRRAHVLVYKGKAEVIEHLERPLRSATSSFTWPHVIRLVHYVRVPGAGPLHQARGAQDPDGLDAVPRPAGDLDEHGLGFTRRRARAAGRATTSRSTSRGRASPRGPPARGGAGRRRPSRLSRSTRRPR